MKLIGANTSARRKGSAISRGRLRLVGSLATAGGLALLPGFIGYAQNGPHIITPPSGIEKPGDVGKRAHTNVEIFVPNGSAGSLQPPTHPGGVQPGAVTPPGSQPPGKPQGAKAGDSSLQR